MDEKSSGRLERVAPRARKFFGEYGANSHSKTGHELAGSSSARLRPPDEIDARAIARQILHAQTGRTKNIIAGRDPQIEAEGIAAELVARANFMLRALGGGASDADVSAADALALESVLHVRGRPALQVYEHRLEEPGPDKHPGSEFWLTFFNTYETQLALVASGAGAVLVQDRYGSAAWVQGTAWLIAPDLVITNRHVLLPPIGMRLVRRVPGASTTARIKTDLEVKIDFAFDAGPARDRACPVLDVVFVAEDNDPVDVAILRISPPASVAQLLPAPLVISPNEEDFNYLYVVGHPGKMQDIPQPVLDVFGTPDERKRISFGETLDPDPSRPLELVHDASTIGGYSGGCVLSFLKPEVAGLHYYGDPLVGNRAFTAKTLKTHAVGTFL